MSRKKPMLCECGCGRSGFLNQMSTVKVMRATDETLLHKVLDKQFLVLHDCKKPFEEELAIEQLMILRFVAHAPKGKTLLQNLNLVATFRAWVGRLKEAGQILRMQHARWERTKGFEYARQRAIHSAWIFAMPRIAVPYFARRWKGYLNDVPKRSDAVSADETDE